MINSGGLYGPGNPMYGVGIRRLLAYNYTKTYSPLTLNKEWPTLWRLLLLIFFTTVGTIINGFFISSFFIENSLKKVGFVYLACIGLADMVITSGVMPAAIVVLISKVWEISPVCYTLQFLTQASTYTYSLLFTMVAVETYIRLCRTRACYRSFLNIPVGFVSFIIFAISFVTSGVGVYYGFDYDYCTRENFGNYTFRFITSLAFYGIPFLCTVSFLTYTSLVVRARAIRLVHYQNSEQYSNDYKFTNLNIACYSLYVLVWLPYLVILNIYPNTTDDKFYNCVWLGLSRSVITSFVYSGLNKNFRRAYSHLFYYCCCKSSITPHLNNRHRRGLEYNVATGNVKVHIMQQTKAKGPKRSAAAGNSRETHLEL